MNAITGQPVPVRVYQTEERVMVTAPMPGLYGNGVLVLSMPKVSAGHVGTRAEFRLITVGCGHGERVGHVGRKAPADDGAALAGQARTEAVALRGTR